MLTKKTAFLFNFIINFRIENIIQNGLLNKWREVHREQQFDGMTIQIKHEDQLNGQITLNQISFAFYNLICCSSFLIVILSIEIL